MKKSSCVKFWLFLVPGLLFAGLASAQAPKAPTHLTAAWSAGTAPNRTITLTWADNADNETAYMVERKIGAAAWADLAVAANLPAGTTTFQDTAVPRAPTTNTVYFYRVRAKNGTTESGAAEVCTAGIPSTEVYDTDADGIPDITENALGLNPADWTDGTGDLDGDGVPNAWEVNMGTLADHPDSSPTSGTANTVTVDPSQPVAGFYVQTITAAIAKFPGGATHPLGSYRVIWVKPGVYNENVVKAATIYSNIAILPLRTVPSEQTPEEIPEVMPKETFEIRGTTTNTATLATHGGLVVDGFILSRSATTSGRIITVSEEAVPLNRVSQVRLVNCIVRGVDTGAESIIRQSRGRLVLSHCTFFMCSATSAAVSHSYSTGPLTTTSPLESTARLHAINSIFWNPVNTSIPEIQTEGDASFLTSIAYQSADPNVPSIPAGTEHVNPGLTPLGYVAAAASPAISGGTINGQVFRDIHGEMRFNPTGRGADEWDDGDGDGIPNFADSNPLSAGNAFQDLDADQINELLEYLGGTDPNNAEPANHTLAQIFYNKTEVDNLFYTRAQSDSLYLTGPELDLEYWRKDEPNLYTKTEVDTLFYTKADSNTLFYTKTHVDGAFYTRPQADALYLTKPELDLEYRRKDEVLRVLPQGGLGMGEFTNGTQP